MPCLKIPCYGWVYECVQFCESLRIGKDDARQHLVVNVNESTVMVASAHFSESVYNPRTEISIAVVE